MIFLFVAVLITLVVHSKMVIAEEITVTGPVQIGTEAGMTWYYVDGYLIGADGLIPNDVASD